MNELELKILHDVIEHCLIRAGVTVNNAVQSAYEDVAHFIIRKIQESNR